MFGRRWCMFGMSCYALVTATIAVTSKSREQIMAARILNYIYVGIELAVVPTFQSEIGMFISSHTVGMKATEANLVTRQFRPRSAVSLSVRIR
jgi:hypothetical protein